MIYNAGSYVFLEGDPERAQVSPHDNYFSGALERTFTLTLGERGAEVHFDNLTLDDLKKLSALLIDSIQRAQTDLATEKP